MFAEKLLDPADPRDLATLALYLSNRDGSELIASRKLIGTEFEPQAIATVKRDLISHNEQLQNQAAQVALDIAPLWANLTTEADTANVILRIVAFAEIGKLGKQERLTDLEYSLESHDPLISRTAAETLATFGSRSAVQILERHIDSAIPHVRVYSCATLLSILHDHPEYVLDKSAAQ